MPSAILLLVAQPTKRDLRTHRRTQRASSTVYLWCFMETCQYGKSINPSAFGSIQWIRYIRWCPLRASCGRRRLT